MLIQKNVSNMKKDLIEYIDNDFYIGTWKLSKLFQAEHRSLKMLIKKYRKDFEEVGEVGIKSRVINDILNVRKSSQKGRPVEGVE